MKSIGLVAIGQHHVNYENYTKNKIKSPIRGSVLYHTLSRTSRLGFLKII
jgi:hypothetical protein